MHQCGNEKIGCVLNIPSGKLVVFIEGNTFHAKFCPFCGYQPERLNERDHLYDNFVQLICDSPNTPTKGSETNRND